MSQRFGNTGAQTDFFKRLFHPTNAPVLLRDRLGRLPAPFGDKMRELAEELYRKIQQTIVGSVWLRSKVTDQGVTVKTRNLAQENVLPHADFTSEMMRAYRNAHHGYFSTGDPGNRPSRYLYLADGNLPAEITLLPVLWFLAYLADPTLVGWHQLPVSAYD
jgi:hypothetical protein